jgi:hypothetical protein
MTQSIIHCAPLTAETLAEFRTRLQHDCTGDGYAEHCTSSPVFVVKERRFQYDIELDYAEKKAIYFNDEYYHSIAEFMEVASDHTKELLDEVTYKALKVKFDQLEEDLQYDTLNLLSYIQIVGYVEHWNYLNVHFTQASADDFINRSRHNYPDGLKVFIESQQYCPEFNAIRNAILSGKLVIKE